MLTATHMAILPGKVCDVITLRGGICEASHTSDEIIVFKVAILLTWTKIPYLFRERIIC